MSQERRHFTDEFKQEAVVCWLAAVGGWSRLPASWGSRPRCCATGAIARGAASGVGGARETGVGHALRCGSGGRDLPASP